MTVAEYKERITHGHSHWDEKEYDDRREAEAPGVQFEGLEVYALQMEINALNQTIQHLQSQLSSSEFNRDYWYKKANSCWLCKLKDKFKGN